MPQVHFRLVPKHWAAIRRTLMAGEYVDGERLVAALIAHRSEPVDLFVLPYLCRFLMRKIKPPKRRRRNPPVVPSRL